MKKKLLSVLLMLIASLGFAQNAGSISIVSIPDSIEAGTTADLQFTYTSNVPVNLVAQMFITNDNALTVNYSGTYQGEGSANTLPADTNATVTVKYTVSGAINPSSTLINGRQYTFALKLVVTGTTTEFAYSNGTANHTVKIVPSSVPLDNINFTAATVTSINPGETLTVPFSYTLAQERNVKAGLAVYTTAGAYVRNATVGTTEVAQYFSNSPVTTTTPVQKTASIVIPAGITPSSQLASGEVYKVVVTIATTAWGYITDKKNDITVLDPASVSDLVLSKLSVFPNPTTDIVNISYYGTIKTLSLYDASGLLLDVNVSSLNNGEAKINTSHLEKGVYVLKVSTNEGIASVKIVK